MNIAINIPAPASRMDHARMLASAITTRHGQTPFEDLDQLSHWLHSTHANPRVLYSTNEEGTALTITWRKDEVVLVIVNAIQ